MGRTYTMVKKPEVTDVCSNCRIMARTPNSRYTTATKKPNVSQEKRVTYCKPRTAGMSATQGR
jgi:trehalose utilization protein